MCSWFLKNPDIWAWGFRFVQRVSCSPISARVSVNYTVFAFLGGAIEDDWLLLKLCRIHVACMKSFHVIVTQITSCVSVRVLSHPGHLIWSRYIKGNWAGWISFLLFGPGLSCTLTSQRALLWMDMYISYQDVDSDYLPSPRKLNSFSAKDTDSLQGPHSQVCSLGDNPLPTL